MLALLHRGAQYVQQQMHDGAELRNGCRCCPSTGKGLLQLNRGGGALHRQSHDRPVVADSPTTWQSLTGVLERCVAVHLAGC